MKKSNVKFGKSSEYKFVSEILGRGHCILQPLDESNDFDFVVNDKKVQVRSVRKTKFTYNKNKNGSISYVERYSCNFPKKTKKVDVVVCYIEPLNKWYIIPFRNIKTRNGSIVVNAKTGNGNMYEKYLDNWSIFNGKNKSFAK